MIPMRTNNFSALTTTLTGENYHILAIKIKTYLKGLNLWEVVDIDAEPIALPSNLTLMQLKKYEEDLSKKPKVLTYIHSVVSDAVFTSIITYESPKEASDKLKRI